MSFKEEQHINVRRILSLRALSIYLQEDDSDLFKSYNQDGEPDVSECPLALLTASANIFTPGDVPVVIEGNIVVIEIPKMLDAFLVLFGLIYVFNIEYPKMRSFKSKTSFQFIVTVSASCDFCIHKDLFYCTV
ncbi:hypothetical protein ILYODFUR_029077 [Ilyodon furcidens]|uniref:Uncharacterized protein n=1 Tax=Ilyodon furcidens TaxID=33524 RepID=A0ABV0SR36_9TELE